MDPFVIVERSAFPVALLSAVALVLGATLFSEPDQVAAAPRRAASELEEPSFRTEPSTPRRVVAAAGIVDRGQLLERLAHEQRLACEEGNPYACESLRQLAISTLRGPTHEQVFTLSGEE